MGAGGKYLAVPVARLREWSKKVNSKYIHWFVIKPSMHETMLLISGLMLEAFKTSCNPAFRCLPHPSLIEISSEGMVGIISSSMHPEGRVMIRTQ